MMIFFFKETVERGICYVVTHTIIISLGDCNQELHVHHMLKLSLFEANSAYLYHFFLTRVE